MSSNTLPTTTEGGTGNTDAQSVVPIAAGVGGGVAGALLCLFIAVILMLVIVMRKRRGYKG